MSETPSSGNRWEPTNPDDSPTPAAGTATAVADRSVPDAPAGPAASVGARRPSLRERVGRIPRSAVLAAVSAFAVVLVGIGGFAVGRATAPDGIQGGVQGGVQGGRPDGLRGFDRDGDGQQGFPGAPGQQPGQAPGQAS